MFEIHSPQRRRERRGNAERRAKREREKEGKGRVLSLPLSSSLFLSLVFPLRFLCVLCASAVKE